MAAAVFLTTPHCLAAFRAFALALAISDIERIPQNVSKNLKKSVLRAQKPRARQLLVTPEPPVVLIRQLAANLGRRPWLFFKQAHPWQLRTGSSSRGNKRSTFNVQRLAVRARAAAWAPRF